MCVNYTYSVRKEHTNLFPVHGCKVHAYVFHHVQKTSTSNSQPLKEFYG